MKGINLRGNSIKDISVFSTLSDPSDPHSAFPELTTLWIGNNDITDIGPLGNLHAIQALSLSTNDIRDIEPLRNLTTLTLLGLGGNRDIENLDPITSLTNLQRLDLFAMGIGRDTLWVVAGLVNLNYLGIGYNNIDDLDALIANPGINDGDYVKLIANPDLDDDHPDVIYLRTRGVMIDL